MPNLFAYFALIIWPLISILFFKRLQVIPATFWTIVGGYLLLPVYVAIDFPLIPPLNKESIAAIAAMFGCKYIKRKKISLIPQSRQERWLFLILLITPFITVLNNNEPIFNGVVNLPGLSYYDALAWSVDQYIGLISFLLGLQLIKSYDDQLIVIKILVIAGLWYSLPILFEVRMSPQLHNWIYGFFPHTSFGQMRRYGGFRPVAFLKHGILVASFVAIVLGAATLLWKEKIKTYRFSALAIVIYFFVLLLLCKTMGALVLGVFLMVAVGFMSISTISLLARFIIVVVILYPMLNFLEVFPHELLLNIATDFDDNRAKSLAFRFHNESRLLEHIQQKPFFGWGGWGRNRFSDTTTDGYWITVLGINGLVGFSAFIGLVVLSVWRGLKASKIVRNKKEKRLLVNQALIVSVIIVEQLLNHTLYSWSWFLIGALIGRANNVIYKSSSVIKTCRIRQQST